MPAGLGFHPYFPAAPGQRLTAQVEGVWLSDEDRLPVRHHPGAWRGAWAEGDAVAGHGLIDHCHTGWAGRVELTAPGRPATLLAASANCRWLHLYIPPDEAFLCIEPVTHMPDPFAGPARGLVTLGPGEALSAWMEIAVDAG